MGNSTHLYPSLPPPTTTEHQEEELVDLGQGTFNTHTFFSTRQQQQQQQQQRYSGTSKKRNLNLPALGPLLRPPCVCVCVYVCAMSERERQRKRKTTNSTTLEPAKMKSLGMMGAGRWEGEEGWLRSCAASSSAPLLSSPSPHTHSPFSEKFASAPVFRFVVDGRNDNDKGGGKGEFNDTTKYPFRNLKREES